MKVVSIIGGLGSQMFKYAFAVRLSELTGEKIWISTIPYVESEMWNGYELNRLFGINASDIAKEADSEILKKVSKKRLSVLDASMQTMRKLEPKTKCTFYRFGVPERWNHCDDVKKSIFERIAIKWNHRNYVPVYDKYPDNYYKSKGIVYYDEFNHTSDKYVKCEKNDLREVFRFPEFTSEKNKITARNMKEEESVSVHVRRSDHMYDSGSLFDRGYYIKAVTAIKDKVSNPVFYIFSEDMEWCRENLESLGLNAKDNITFVDWNSGEESYRDMQLMTFCKHNVLCLSTFSWWGYYLSIRKDKIVIAPETYWTEVENHF